jgi:serine/threonine-protein kinase
MTPCARPGSRPGCTTPAIPPVREVGTVGDRPDLVTRFVEGRSLAEIGRDGPLTPRDAAQLVAAVADAVHHAHEQGIVHRDLRPGTILVDAHGRPHLTDFGLAVLSEGGSFLTEEPPSPVGNPAYVSPEMLLGAGSRIDGRGDVYGPGLVLHDLLTGRLPSPTEPMPEAVRHTREGNPPPRAPARRIDRDLEAIRSKVLASDPDRRHPTASAPAEDWQRFLTGRPIGMRPTSRSRWRRPLSRR